MLLETLGYRGRVVVGKGPLLGLNPLKALGIRATVGQGPLLGLMLIEALGGRGRAVVGQGLKELKPQKRPLTYGSSPSMT